MPRRLLLIRHCDEEPGLGAWPCLAEVHAWQRGESRRPLTAIGRRRAARLAEMVVNFDPGLLLTSPLARARQTAEILGERLGLTPQPMEQLSEIVFGRVKAVAAWPMRSRRRGLARVALPRGAWPPLMRGLWLLGGTRPRVSPEAARRRAGELARALSARDEPCVAVVTHGVVLLELLDALCSRRPSLIPRPRHLLRTGEFCLLERREAMWQIVGRQRAPARVDRLEA